MAEWRHACNSVTLVQVSDAMKKLCTDVHVFKSWTAVGGDEYLYK